MNLDLVFALVIGILMAFLLFGKGGHPRDQRTIMAEGMLSSCQHLTQRSEGLRIKVTLVRFSPQGVVSLFGNVNVPFPPGTHVIIFRSGEKYEVVKTIKTN